MKKSAILALGIFSLVAFIQTNSLAAVPVANAHWNFEISLLQAEVVQETPVSGKFAMLVDCTGILKGFEALNGIYTAQPINQVEAILNADVVGSYKGNSLRIVSVSLVNISTGACDTQSITVTFTDKKGIVYETYNLKATGSFTPYYFTFQSLTTVSGTLSKK